MEPVIIVQFIRGNPPYNAGEKAGFTKDEAQRFINAGVAILDKDSTVAANKARGIVADEAITAKPESVEESGLPDSGAKDPKKK